MSTIKLKRGTGSPAGSLEEYEVAMDVDARTLYVSSDGVDAVVLADNTEYLLANATSEITVNPRLMLNDGMNIVDPDATLTDAVLNIKVDQSGYNRAQMMFEDSNAKVFSMVGHSGGNRDRFIVSLDPDNIHSPTTTASYAGDYGVYYLKQYNNLENPAIEMNVFGAKDAFKLRVYDDNNSGSPALGPLGYAGYGYKPFEAHCENFQVHARDSDTSTRQVLTVDDSVAEFEVPIIPVLLNSTERDALTPVEGMLIYNTTDLRLEFYDGGNWKYINSTNV